MTTLSRPDARAPAVLTPAQAEARLGQRLAARLDEGERQLPHDIVQRLRVARQQALQAARARRAVQVRHQPDAWAQQRSHAASLGEGTGRGDFWGRLGPAALALAAVVALMLAPDFTAPGRAIELAAVDAALLTDDLPPQAYADPGFAQFLKTGAAAHSGLGPSSVP